MFTEDLNQCDKQQLLINAMADNNFSFPSLVLKQGSAIERNVFYSSDYSPNNSYDELFNFEKQTNAQKPMRKRNFPDSFFTPPSASSSACHSRESSLDANNNCSPNRMPGTSQCQDGNTGFEESFSNIDIKPSSISSNLLLGQYHAKTQSLPASFSPENNQIQLQPFCHLHRNLIRQSKLRAANSALMNNVSSESEVSTPNFILRQNSPFQDQVYSTVRQLDSNIVQQATIDNQAWVPLQLNQQGNMVSNTLASICTQATPSSQSYNLSHSQYLPSEYLQNTVQQLEKECENMKKRQVELQQINLIGSNRVNSACQSIPSPHRSLTSIYQLNGNCNLQDSAPQSHSLMIDNNQGIVKQESLDSGLDLTCHSSSTDSTNQMSQDFVHLTNCNVSRADCNNNSNHHKMTFNQKPPLEEATVAKSLFCQNYNNSIKSDVGTVNDNKQATDGNKTNNQNCCKLPTLNENECVSSNQHASTIKWKAKMAIASPLVTSMECSDFLYNNQSLLDIYDSIDSSAGIDILLSPSNEINSNQMCIGEDSYNTFHEFDLLDPLSNLNQSDHISVDQNGVNFITY